MNFLAHAYLSFNHPAIIMGNMISDFVKGKKRFDYPKDVQKGIMLHRAIDEFTDKHPTTKAGSHLFRPHYKLYAASFMDVVYDHFLACDATRFDDTSLRKFAQHTYQVLDTYESIMPQQFKRIFPYMKKQNWLYNYHSREGIYNSLKGLVHRAAYISDSGPAIEVFDTHYEQLRQCYEAFFPELERFAQQKLEEA